MSKNIPLPALVLLVDYKDKKAKQANTEHLLRLRVNFGGDRRYFDTEQFFKKTWRFTKEEWSERVNVPSPTKSYRGKKDEVEKVLFRAKAILETMEKDLTDFTFTRFEELWYVEKAKGTEFGDVLNAKYWELKPTQYKMADQYRITYESLKSYNGGKTLRYADITVSFLKGWERWMLNGANDKEKGKEPKPRSQATIGMYSRCIRHVWNMAIDAEYVNEKAYPFGKGKMKYKIPQGGNDPKPLTPEQVNQLMEYVPVNAEVKRWNDRDARNKWEDYARDMWLLSCSVNGVNPKDMCKWDWSNLTKTEKGWQLLWQRSKTIRTLKVPLYGKKILKEDEYKLLMKWANPRSEKYILPVLTQELLESRYDRKANKFVKVMEKDKEQRISALVDNFTHYVNEGLDRICENGGVVGRESIRFYDARDTYANLLKKGGANPFAIQQGLIHKYFSTTEKYLGTLNDDEMQENDQIIEDAMTKAKEARKAKLVKSA